MRILLHVCCGPCSTYVVKHLRSLGHTLTGYFFNPNIQPQAEYEKRLAAAQATSDSAGLELYVDNSNIAETWQRAVEKDLAKRCYHCYRLRLDKIAEVAAKEGFDAFGTTLLISPFQQHDDIKRAGYEAARLFGSHFYYEDLRPHFKATYQLARDAGLYRQNYCGCLYSRAERELQRQSRKAQDHS